MSKDKIIVALDVDSTEKAVELVQVLRGKVGAFKVGLELVNSAGLGVLDAIKQAGADKIFYDCKFHDIPNTVAGAAKAVAGFGVWMFNVHASGGSAMMGAAVEAAHKAADAASIRRPLVIAVTVLTSIDSGVLSDELGVTSSLQQHIKHLALMAKSAGLDGVVASPLEVQPIREACGDNFLIVTPGVRPAGADIGDQKRVMTPKGAIAAGADYLVIGRPITKAPDPAKAADDIARNLV